jgi:hypothetical protein
MTRRSIARQMPLLVLTLIIVANRWQKTDPDLWGHIRFGQVMLSSRHIVAYDIYSYTARGAVWRDHEYLSEVVMAAAYNLAGIIGLKLWKFLCLGGSILCIADGLAGTEANCLVQLNALALTAGLLVSYAQFRPQLHTYLLFALMLAVLARDNYRRPGSVWLMVPIMAVWSNLHGGFIIGIISLLIYTLSVAVEDSYAHGSLRRAGSLAAMTAVSAGATLLPPCGFNGWRAVDNGNKPHNISDLYGMAAPEHRDVGGVAAFSRGFSPARSVVGADPLDGSSCARR